MSDKDRAQKKIDELAQEHRRIQRIRFLLFCFLLYCLFVQIVYHVNVFTGQGQPAIMGLLVYIGNVGGMGIGFWALSNFKSFAYRTVAVVAIVLNGYSVIKYFI